MLIFPVSKAKTAFPIDEYPHLGAEPAAWRIRDENIDWLARPLGERKKRVRHARSPGAPSLQTPSRVICSPPFKRRSRQGAGAFIRGRAPMIASVVARAKTIHGREEA